MVEAYLNVVGTALPKHEVHGCFKDFARRQITGRRQVVLDRMLSRSGIEQRWSTLSPSDTDDSVDKDGFYSYGSFPPTSLRMARYDAHATEVAGKAVRDLGIPVEGVTHLLVTSCTGLSAPGVDLQLIDMLGLSRSVERTLIGFMGCYAGITALRLARQIVRGEPRARVLIVSVELCTLHLQETDDLEKILSFSIFGDGAAACLVTSEAVGMRLDKPVTATLPAARDLIRWNVGEQGFDMVLSGKTPAALAEGLPPAMQHIAPEGHESISRWAVHPGGKSILDAVEDSLSLEKDALAMSRRVLKNYGNMSSATVLFVLKEMLDEGVGPAELGVAMAFGPGLTAETIRFSGCA